MLGFDNNAALTKHLIFLFFPLAGSEGKYGNKKAGNRIIITGGEGGKEEGKELSSICIMYLRRARSPDHRTLESIQRCKNGVYCNTTHVIVECAGKLIFSRAFSLA